MKKLNTYEAWYMEQLNNILENGQRRGDRTGTGVISLPNVHYTHDLRESYPLMFARQFNFIQPIVEKIWMMSGSSNIQFLKDNGCPFWNGFAVKGDKIAPVELDRLERLKLLGHKRGVPYGAVLQMFANEPVTEIDAELDKQEIPNTQDMLIAKDGELGPVYGVQWRHWPNPDGTTFDQLTYALETLRKDPNSRRVVVNCWNPSFLPDPKKSPAENAIDGKMALTACHFNFGFYTWKLTLEERIKELYGYASDIDRKWLEHVGPSDLGYLEYINKLFEELDIPTHYLDINFTMRSNDWVLGQPANMNMYSALLMMFAQQLNMIPRYVNYTGWDAHVYTNHLEGVKELQCRWDTGEYDNHTFNLELHKAKDLFSYQPRHFVPVTDGFESLMGEKIKFPIAI